MSENLPEAQSPQKNAVVPIDNGKPALYNPAAFAQIWRAAQMFSSSDLVPAAYKGKPENCFIAIEMADRMGISPFAMLQSLVIIQGKPSMEAKLIIALVNDSGLFEDPLEYEVVGDDPHSDDYKVRCFAKMKKTGKMCLGPWITYKMVKGEGWLDKGGSKWKTIPSLMFMYRAASFFAKVFCPNITMGMQTREEMEDVPPINITPERVVVKQLTESTGQGAVVETVVDAEPPKRERGKPAHGKQRRTAVEVEEDRLADEFETLQAAPETVNEETGEVTGGDEDDDSWPDPPDKAESVKAADPEPVKPAGNCPDLF